LQFPNSPKGEANFFKASGVLKAAPL